MFGKNNYFNGNFTNSSKYKINIRKTKKIFDLFLKDWENGQIPLLESYEISSIWAVGVSKPLVYR